MSEKKKPDESGTDTSKSEEKIEAQGRQDPRNTSGHGPKRGVAAQPGGGVRALRTGE
jgi:hypothetical protein